MKSLVPGAIYTGLLAASNWMVYLVGPKLKQVSGNGVSPEQFGLMLLSLVLVALWLPAIRRAAGSLAMRLSDAARLGAALAGGALGFVLILWAARVIEGYGALFWELHGRNMPSQHTFSYWAITWQFWAGLACLAAGAGVWRGERMPAPAAREAERRR